MKLSEIVFRFIDEFFIQESQGIDLSASSSCQEERWAHCKACEHYDEPEKGCKYCHCYLPNKIKDPWGDCPLDKWISNSEQWHQEHYEFLKQKLISKYPELEEHLNGKD